MFQIENELEKMQRTENIMMGKLEDAKIQIGSLRQRKAAFDEKLVKRNELLIQNIKTWRISEIDQISSEEGKILVECHLIFIVDKTSYLILTCKLQLQMPKVTLIRLM